MTDLRQYTVESSGGACRVIEGGTGPRVGVIPGHGGAPRWTPFLDRLAESRTVVLLSLPGFPGSDRQYEKLDGQIDWLVATLDLLDGASLRGCDLLANSIGAVVAADIAALSPGYIRSLSLAAPYGLFDVTEPMTDIFAHTADELPALLCNSRENYDAAFGEPADRTEIVDWRMMAYRASAAAARLVWPFGDRGLAKRLHRIAAPTQLMFGGKDRIVPASYMQRFAHTLPNVQNMAVIPDAGHLVWIDQPNTSAVAVLKFLDEV